MRYFSEENEFIQHAKDLYGLLKKYKGTPEMHETIEEKIIALESKTSSEEVADAMENLLNLVDDADEAVLKLINGIDRFVKRLDANIEEE